MHWTDPKELLALRNSIENFPSSPFTYREHVDKVIEIWCLQDDSNYFEDTYCIRQARDIIISLVYQAWERYMIYRYQATWAIHGASCIRRRCGCARFTCFIRQVRIHDYICIIARSYSDNAGQRWVSCWGLFGAHFWRKQVPRSLHWLDRNTVSGSKVNTTK